MNSKKIFTIPNILSIFRIILIPVFIYLYITGDIKNAFILFIISGITDMLDGFIARKFNQISDIGKVLDPLADKITLISVLSCLYFNNLIHLLLFLIMLSKEIFQIIGGIFLWKKKIVVQSNIWGKLTTIMFYISISFILIWPDKIIGSYLLIICLILAIIAVVNYTIKNKKIYNKQKLENKYEKENY
jgi:cardiolipin synthase